MIMIFFFFLFHESDSVYKFDDFFFSIRVEMYLYEGYFSLYENLSRVKLNYLKILIEWMVLDILSKILLHQR